MLSPCSFSQSSKAPSNSSCNNKTLKHQTFQTETQVPGSRSQERPKPTYNKISFNKSPLRKPRSQRAARVLQGSNTTGARHYSPAEHPDVLVQTRSKGQPRRAKAQGGALSTAASGPAPQHPRTRCSELTSFWGQRGRDQPVPPTTKHCLCAAFSISSNHSIHFWG